MQKKNSNLFVGLFLSVLCALAPMAGIADETIVVPVPEVTPSCTKSTVADVYTVTELRGVCGDIKHNSGLRGVIHRRNECNTETTVATVFACTQNCNDCQTKEAIKEIRCERGSCCSVERVHELIGHLASPSHRVRRQASVSLEQCHLRVKHVRTCVDAPVPSTLWY